MNHLMMVSTVGTSLWTNGAPEDVRKDLLKHANAEHLNAFDHQTLIEDFLKDQTEKLMSSDPAVAKRMSAELNGILTFREQQAHASEHHVLIASKTFVGERAARAVREWLIQHGIKTVEVRVIDDLVTNNLERFRLAMGQIVNCCAQELGLPNQHQHTVFNLTGGFKSVQGFMQTVGMLWADECISIFGHLANHWRGARSPAGISFDAPGTRRACCAFATGSRNPARTNWRSSGTVDLG
jgi:putative CRISPR-associated protein (TIGR02619 family)